MPSLYGSCHGISGQMEHSAGAESDFHVVTSRLEGPPPQQAFGLYPRTNGRAQIRLYGLAWNRIPERQNSLSDLELLHAPLYASP